MNSVLIAFTALALLYGLGYWGWSKRLSEKIFGVSADEVTPANDPALQDGVDYVPTQKAVLWGHHYTSIAGAAPIIGPAVAVFWGWLPALLWIVFGSIFIGAVHDFGALVVSTRNQGRTMADLAGEIIHPRARLLFQIITYFLIWIVLAVFGFAIGVLFDSYPASVIPINVQIVVAVIIGFLFYKKKVPILIPSIIALLLLYAMIPVGLAFPISLSGFIGETGAIHLQTYGLWAIILLIYSGFASVLPVWLLLQPRDYINSHQLIVGLSLLLLGLVVLHPDMAAPMINLSPQVAEEAPALFPLLFVTIACGAISGFHGLVSSGTTAKQINNMTDARAIGYGGMLGEAMLAVIATIAVAAGLQDWGTHYAHWDTSGIKAVAKFVQGAGHFVTALGLPLEAAQTLVAVLAIAFAATSMDTAARIQRYIVSEMGQSLKISFIQNRYVATAIAVLPAVPLVLAGKSAWGPLWLLFGTTNQLIGGMTFLVLFVYLYRAQKPTWMITLPMLFVVSVTTLAMVVNLSEWIFQTDDGGANWFTVGVGGAILVLELWMIIEAVVIILKLRREQQLA
ncbi:MAG: carbon starvation protein A [Vampirovibrio sp.]|nr:carbon starvation protein A [Vampirovibrio sp.]